MLGLIEGLMSLITLLDIMQVNLKNNNWYLLKFI